MNRRDVIAASRDLFAARSQHDLFNRLCAHLGRAPTSAELRTWVNSVFGPFHIDAELLKRCT